jgi:hypothetical protein
MRGKTQKRAGGLLNTGGCIFFKHCQCHMDGKYYPWGLYTGGKVRGISVTFPKGQLVRETLEGICIQEEQTSPALY